MSLSDFKQSEERDAEFRNSKGKVKAAPNLPAAVKIADTHCHLSMLDDPALAIARAAYRGFGLLCCLVDPGESSPDSEGQPSAREALELADSWLEEARIILDEWGAAEAGLPELVYAVGVHPHNAKHFDACEEELRDLLKHPRVTCLGEIGLDYHYDLSPRDAQRRVFAEQLKLAQELDLPVSLHIREAHDEALEILHEAGVPDRGCIVHCFNLDGEVLKPFVDLGCYIAFGGPLTFKKAYYTREACTHVPLDRLLTETDAPFMAPEPLRGTVCTPDMTAYTLRILLDSFGYAGEQVAVDAWSPRQTNIDNGATPVALGERDIEKLQQGLSEVDFCQKIYSNAVELLGHKR